MDICEIRIVKIKNKQKKLYSHFFLQKSKYNCPAD